MASCEGNVGVVDGEGRVEGGGREGVHFGDAEEEGELGGFPEAGF